MYVNVYDMIYGMYDIISSSTPVHYVEDRGELTLSHVFVTNVKQPSLAFSHARNKGSRLAHKIEKGYRVSVSSILYRQVH